MTAVVNERTVPLLLSGGDETRMKAEHEAALEHYERRAEQLPIDITVRENVSSTELGRIFESYNDFVHYIGHRDERGLECSNGYFDMESISESKTRTFFLNACGSYPDGRELIRKGSVAGGITYEQVADSSAAEVGTSFARILMQGFSIERAMRKASQQLMTPKDYAVVGDGTHVVTQSDALRPPGVWIFDGTKEDYRIIKASRSPNKPGISVTGYLDDIPYLSGVGREYHLSKDELSDFLDYQDSPIIYKGEMKWAEELASELC